MLEQLISEIRAGGTLETKTLATRLGTSPQLIEAMLEHLQRNGLIQAYDNCGDGCEGCSLKSGCSPGGKAGAVRLWQSSSK